MGSNHRGPYEQQQHEPTESKGARLRALLEGRDPLLMPGVYDGISARLVQQAGFSAAMVGGSGISESRLGLPDLGFLGLEENVRAAHAIAATTDLLLIADADTGYGNAVNVYRTVQEFEAAGAAGVAIEDQVWPKRCGHLRGKDVIPADEMVEKIRAAVEARRDPSLVIKARTDAAAVLGVDEAIRRLQMYASAGADHVVADALTSADDIRKVCDAVQVPVAVNMGFGLRNRSTTPLLSVRELARMGVSAVTYPRMLTAAAISGMRKALDAFIGGFDDEVPTERPDLVVAFDDINELMNLAEFEEREQRFRSGRPRGA